MDKQFKKSSANNQIQSTGKSYTQIMVWFLSFIILSTLFGCSSATSTTLENTDKNPIVIGWIGPLTGDAAIIGVPNKNGVEVAVSRINAQGGIHGHDLKVLFEDDQLQTEQTVKAYHKLVEVDGARIILSVSYGALLTLVDAAKNDNVILINSLDVSEELAKAGDHVFAVGVYDEGIGYTVADFIPSDKKVAVVYNTAEPFIVLVKNSFEKRFLTREGHIFFQGYNPDPTQLDARTLILKAQQQDVDALLVLGYDETGTIVRQAREMGFNGMIYGIDTATSPGFHATAKGSEEGMFMTYWYAPNNTVAETFLVAYRKHTGKNETDVLYSATGYDTMLVLGDALTRSENEQTSNVQNALYTVKNLQGVTGTLTMDSDGVVRSIQEKMFQYQGGIMIPR